MLVKGIEREESVGVDMCCDWCEILIYWPVFDVIYHPTKNQMPGGPCQGPMVGD